MRVIDHTKRFHREVIQVLSERGWISIDLLKLDDQPLAAIYGFIYQGVYYSYMPGFDPAALAEFFREPSKRASTPTKK